MSVYRSRLQELEDVDRHIAEAQRRVDDFNRRITGVEQAGGDTSALWDLLRQFEHALAHLTASRDALQRQTD